MILVKKAMQFYLYFLYVDIFKCNIMGMFREFKIGIFGWNCKKVSQYFLVGDIFLFSKCIRVSKIFGEWGVLD
ncbi:hypothetical protein COM13_18820 [Bacillus pseudomycoides]|nr:hypothetical protein COO07_17430 [Bacillus pseudomycoides]PGB87519.1 hypothetical protein COM13_18820 [Bacillus pseudomycoides]